MSLLKPKINWEEDYSSKVLLLLVVILLVVFGVRLWFLQILKGDYFVQKSLENRTRFAKIYAPRGLIFDREKRPLAFNEPAYDLALVREDCSEEDCSQHLKFVSTLLKVDYKQLKATLAQNRKRVKKFEPLILLTNLSFEDLAKIEGRINKWQALKIIVRPRRKYNNPFSLSHVLGYVSLAREEDLSLDPNLSPGDYVGMGGIEKSYEKELRGEKGEKKLEVDALGRVFKEEVIEQPVPGKDIILSLDKELQRYVYNLLADKAGTVIVLDPSLGQVLSLVSSPGYDINQFVLGIDVKSWKKLVNNPLHPLQNKAIQGTYPPGSVFKLIMAGYLLAKQNLDLREKVFCNGEYRLGRRVFRCWRKEGHGLVDLRRALIESCDVYFYKQGEDIDIDKLKEFVLGCGLGRPTFIDLPYEKGGFFPDREWKLKRFGEPWQKGENLNISIGQGYILVTPLQIAKFIAGLINDGIMYKPSLLLTEKQLNPQNLPFSKNILEFIKESMVQTVRDKRGTARILKLKGAIVGAKTGTAQVVKLKDEHLDKDLEEIPYKYRDHAWMASFGIIGNKKYVVVCLLEHGGHGASGSGPIVRKIYEYLIDKNVR